MSACRLFPLALFLLGTTAAHASTATWSSSEDFNQGTFEGVQVTEQSLVLQDASDWLDSHWGYRLPVEVIEQSGVSLQDGFEVGIRVNTEALVENGLLQADADDLRAVSETGEVLPLYFNVETVLAPDALVWVRLPSLEAYASHLIYLYIANSKADTVSSIQETFTWFDDFQRDSLDSYTSQGLEGADDAAWVHDDQLGMVYPTDDGTKGSSLLVDGLGLTDHFLIEALAQNQDDDGLGVIANVDAGGYTYYTAQGWGRQASRTGISDSNFDAVVAKAANVSVLEGELHAFGLSRHGHTLTMYFDGQPVTSYEDSEGVLEGDRLGVISLRNAPAALFDRLLIRRFLDPAPEVLVGDVEAYGYVPEGQWLSQVIDSGCTSTAWTGVEWTEQAKDGSQVEVAIRVGSGSTTNPVWTNWLTLEGTGAPDVVPGALAQLRVTLRTVKATVTPSLSELSLTYTPAQDDDLDGVDADTCGGTDCDDADPSSYPGAIEQPYDGVDNDCDGEAGTDLDQDGWDGYPGTDCNDEDANIHPDAEETCNAVDDDCSGVIDDHATDSLIYFPDHDGDGYGDPTYSVESCQSLTGYVLAGGDCDDSNPSAYPGAGERCDGDDNDCDGSIDEGVSKTYFVDADQDGFGDASQQVVACAQTPTTAVLGGDCNDADATVNPGASDLCGDGVDADCNGTDPTCPVNDADSDGYAPEDGDCDDANASVHPNAFEVCGNGIDEDCTGGDVLCPPVDDDGDGLDETAGDCDDFNSSVYPGAPEVCGDGVDQDCSGADLSCDASDADGDGYTIEEGDCDDTNSAVHPGALEVPYNGVDDDCANGDRNDVDRDGYAGGDNGTDCDDTSPSTYPGAPELCDGQDNDCSGEADDRDEDGDGTIAEACGGTDCDDTRIDVNPNAAEVADGRDNDCDGVKDEGTGAYDDDGDGVSELQGDCDDANPDISPYQEEVPNDGIDNNCDDQIDEGLETPSPTPEPAELAPVPGVEIPAVGCSHASGASGHRSSGALVLLAGALLSVRRRRR